MFIENFDEYYNKYLNKKVTKEVLAKELNISINILEKMIKEYSIFSSEILKANEEIEYCILEKDFDWNLK